MKKIIKLILTIIIIILAVFMTIMFVYSILDSTKTTVIEFYKYGGTIDEDKLVYHYSIYESKESLQFGISSISKSTNETISNNIIDITDKTIVENFKNALNEYIESNYEIKYLYTINEHYNIEYNDTIIMVPNPEIVEQLGYDPTPFSFYNTIEAFIANFK